MVDVFSTQSITLQESIKKYKKLFQKVTCELIQEFQI